MAGFENNVMLAKNMNFDPEAAKPHLGIINAAGKLPIGTGNVQPSPEILGGFIVSNTLDIGYSSPNITINNSRGLLQQVRTNSNTFITVSDAIPDDDTIPQISEGDQIFSLAITPTSASSILSIEFSGMVGADGSVQPVFALFLNGDANAIYATTGNSPSGQTNNLQFMFYKTAASTSAQTFTLRCGVPSSAGGGSVYINGTMAARVYGGASTASLTITEIST